MRNAYLPALIGCLLWNVPSTARAAFLPVRSGEIARYRLTYHGEGTINFRMLMGQQAGAPDTMASDLQAQMEIVQVTPGTFAVRLIAPAYQLRVNGQTPDLSRQVAALTEPCYLTVDSAGRIRSLSFAPETPAAMRTLLRAVLSDLQFARPAAGANSRQWKTQQDTANGAADVAYRALDAATYEKRICAYPVTRQIGPKGDPGCIMRRRGPYALPSQKVGFGASEGP